MTFNFVRPFFQKSVLTLTIFFATLPAFANQSWVAQPLYTLRPETQAWLTTSPKGERYVARVRNDRGQNVWAIFATANGKKMLDLQLPNPGWNDEYQMPSWSPDGSQIALLSENKAHFFDTKTGQRFRVIYSEKQPVDRIIWHPDGQTVAMVQPELTRFYNLRQKTFTGSVEGDQKYCPFAWSPNGRYLTTCVKGLSGKALKIRNVKTGVEKTIFDLDTSHTPIVRWSPDSKRIFIHSIDGAPRILNVESDTLMKIDQYHFISNAEWSADGKRLLYYLPTNVSTCGGCQDQPKRVSIWNDDYNLERLTFETDVNFASFLPDNVSVLTSHRKYGEISDSITRVWQNGEVVFESQDAQLAPRVVLAEVKGVLYILNRSGWVYRWQKK
jgi:dipeptidyl aminopeptidase/acylaminoacyl peptidase